MKPKKKLLVSAASLAVLASSLSGACAAQQTTSLGEQSIEPADGAQALVGATVQTTATAAPSDASSSAVYADGIYTGSASPTRWGDVQVSAVVQNGSIIDIEFLTYPNGDPRSAQINAQANGMLIQEAIQTQSAQVQVISGATYTSLAFMESLESALSQAG